MMKKFIKMTFLPLLTILGLLSLNNKGDETGSIQNRKHTKTDVEKTYFTYIKSSSDLYIGARYVLGGTLNNINVISSTIGSRHNLPVQNAELFGDAYIKTDISQVFILENGTNVNLYSFRVEAGEYKDLYLGVEGNNLVYTHDKTMNSSWDISFNEGHTIIKSSNNELTRNTIRLDDNPSYKVIGIYRENNELPVSLYIDYASLFINDAAEEIRIFSRKILYGIGNNVSDKCINSYHLLSAKYESLSSEAVVYFLMSEDEKIMMARARFDYLKNQYLNTYNHVHTKKVIHTVAYIKNDKRLYILPIIIILSIGAYLLKKKGA